MKRKRMPLTRREEEHVLRTSWASRLDELVENLQEVGERLPEEKQRDLIESAIYLLRRDAKDIEKQLKIDSQSRTDFIFRAISEIPRGICFDYRDIAKNPGNPYRDPSIISVIITKNPELREKHDIYRISSVGMGIVKWLKPTLEKGIRRPRLSKEGLEIVKSGYETPWGDYRVETSKMSERDRVIFSILRRGYSEGYPCYGHPEERKRQNIEYIERAASLVDLPIAKNLAGEPEVIYHPGLLRSQLSFKQIIS